MTIGEGTKIASNLITAEPYLITIGKNVTISHGVDFVTHDNCVCKLFGVSNDLYGRITIGNNCFIGAHATILYGVSLANNVIVAAGSVVTKSVNEERVIVAGNPAKIIGSWDKFEGKVVGHVINTKGLSVVAKKEKLLANEHKFVKK